MGRRFLAFLSDLWLLMILAILVSACKAGGHIQIDETRARRILLVLWLFYMVLALYFTRTTLGKRLMGVEVRSSRSGANRPAIWDLAMRETIYRYAAVWMFGMGYYKASADRRCRADTDRLANTIVVRSQGKPSRAVRWFFLLSVPCTLIAAGILAAL